jgi:hypothetical protein
MPEVATPVAEPQLELAAPAVEATPNVPAALLSEETNLDALLNDATEAAVKDALPQDPDTPLRDEKGRFLPKNPEEGAEVVAEGAVTEPVAEGEPEPETPVAGTVPKLAREPIMPLKVKLGETDFEGVPDLTVTWTGPGGKERTEPLDKLTRLASDGIYSEQREARYREATQTVTQTQERLAQIEAAYREVAADREAMLTDEVNYLARKDAWDRENTPQMREQRLRDELAQVNRQRELDVIGQQGEAFFTGTVTPAVETITKALPLVSAEEIVARLQLDIRSLTGPRGYLMPEQYQQVADYIVKDLAPWAKGLNAHRSERFTPKEVAVKATQDAADAKAKADKAAVDAQKGRNIIARATKPVSTGGRSTTPPPKTPKPIISSDDAMDAGVEEAVTAALAIT